MSGQLGELVVSISADIARFQSDMGKAVKVSQESADSMSKALNGVQGTIGGIGKAFGLVTAALAGGAMFKDMIGTTKEVSSEIVKLKNSLGISAEEASVMRVALDDVFLSADDMAAASSRITKQLVKNEEAFKKLGVATRDGNGNFRSTTDIMVETNTQLLKFKEGTDRNVEGMKIYGKGWDEARKTLKLTAEGMKEAKDRAEELHLIMGESGLKAVKEYKLAMKDIGDVSESFKVQVGTALMPSLTKLAAVFGDITVKAIVPFSGAITWSMQQLEESGAGIRAFIDKFKAEASNPFAYLTKKGRAGLKAELDAIEAMHTYTSTKIALKYGDIVKARTRNDKSGDTSTGDDKKESDWTSAHNKYIEYLKAFEEQKAAITKAANDFALEQDKQAYDWGLVDYRTYLTEKQRLTLSTLDAEMTAKQNELVNAQNALANLKPSLGKKGESQPDKDAANYHDALKKVAEAQKAVTEANIKYSLEVEKDKNEFDVAVYTTTRGYQEQQAALADFQGDYARGAAIRKALDENSLATRKLIADAMTEDAAAESAYWAQKTMNAEKYDATLEGGVLQSLREYGNDAKNIHAQMADFTKSTFKSMEDAIVNFTQTGKFSFHDMANSIITDLIRIATRQAITGPLASALSGISDWASLGTSGVEMANSPPANLAQFAVGTDYVPKTGIAVIHEGEAIIPASQNRASGAAPVINIINNASDQVSAKPVGVPRLDAGQWVVDMVIAKLRSDPGTRAAFAGGGSF